jgi:hypothetical protein
VLDFVKKPGVETGVHKLSRKIDLLVLPTPHQPGGAGLATTHKKGGCGCQAIPGALAASAAYLHRLLSLDHTQRVCLPIADQVGWVWSIRSYL